MSSQNTPQAPPTTPINTKKYQLLSTELNTQDASNKLVSELSNLYKDEKGEKQVPKEFNKDLEFCGQPVSIFCYQNPDNCKSVFEEYIKNVTMEGIKSSDSTIYHQICDEAKKPNGRFKNEEVRKNILKSCDDKYATNMCLDKNRRYTNPTKETFAGNCTDICKNTKDIDLKLACMIGTINYCLKNKDKLSESSCIFRDYFDVDGANITLKNFPTDKASSKKIDEFLKTNNKVIKRFQKEYCQTFEGTKPNICENIDSQGSSTSVPSIPVAPSAPVAPSVPSIPVAPSATVAPVAPIAPVPSAYIVPPPEVQMAPSTNTYFNSGNINYRGGTKGTRQNMNSSTTSNKTIILENPEPNTDVLIIIIIAIIFVAAIGIGLIFNSFRKKKAIPLDDMDQTEEIKKDEYEEVM